jgi:FkbM family methyltransferase
VTNASEAMKLVGVPETLVLDIRGQQVELRVPANHNAIQAFKRQQTTQPDYRFEAVMTAALEKVFDALDQPLFFDVGAYIGYYTARGGKLLEGKGRVWGIESNPKHVAVLREIIDLNGLRNAEAVHAALSDRGEPLRTIDEEVWTDTAGEGAVVQAETCDALCERLGVRPNVAKIDVHGFEGKVLGGMRELLRDGLDYVLLELHPNAYLERFTPGITRLTILDILDEAGLRIYYVAGHRKPSSEVLRPILEDGRFVYQQITRENRRVLLFDRHVHLFVMATRRPLEEVLGASILDPGLA